MGYAAYRLWIRLFGRNWDRMPGWLRRQHRPTIFMAGAAGARRKNKERNAAERETPGP